MASRGLTITGALFLLFGVAALIHPRIEMPAHKSELEINSQKVILETRRIVTLPWFFGGFLAVSGAAVILLGVRKP